MMIDFLLCIMCISGFPFDRIERDDRGFMSEVVDQCRVGNMEYPRKKFSFRISTKFLDSFQSFHIDRSNRIFCSGRIEQSIKKKTIDTFV